jgi:hypothetical protein
VTANDVFQVVVPDTIWVTERQVWYSGVKIGIQPSDPEG